MKINEIDFNNLITRLEENAWNGRPHDTAYIINNNDIIKIHGYVYEPSYESYSTTCTIEMNNEILFAEESRNIDAFRNESYTYGKFKSSKEAIEYIKKYMRDKEIILQYEEPDINEVVDIEAEFEGM